MKEYSILTIRSYFFIYLFFLPLITFAQPTKIREGTYTYYSSSNQSLDEAKHIALQRAQLQIIADEYGTIITQTNSTTVTNDSGKSTVDFSSIGISDVCGEWLETINEPKYTFDMAENGFVVTVTVKGKIREVTRAEVSFQAKLLRDGIDFSCESDSFHDNNQLFISFLSPTSGYLAIYLVDGSKAFCLFPYPSMEDGMCKLKSNYQYILFSPEHSSPIENKKDVEEYFLTCSEKNGTNQIFIIFSPNQFIKAVDYQKTAPESYKEQKLELPRELSAEDFNKWLAKNRARDKEMQVDMRVISLYK